MYNPAQLEKMKELGRDFLYFFNYADHPEEGLTDHTTAFFTYDRETKHDEKKLAELFGGYKRANARALEQVCESGRSVRSFAFNDSCPVDLGIRKIGPSYHPYQIKE